MIFVCALIFLLAGGATAGMLRYASSSMRLDVPNDRSLHQTPTPRGGGLAIVGVFILSAVAFLLVDKGPSYYWIYLAGAVFVAAIGWMDDRYSLSAKARLLVHLGASALLILSLLRFAPESELLTLSFGIQAIGFGIATLLCAWCINFYNFMDGSDGIAAIEALSVGLVWGLLVYYRGGFLPASLSLALAAASAGFLLFNWSPAKIFMGDVASGFMGYAFMGLFVIEDLKGRMPIQPGLILIGCFMVDASYTLFIRFRRGVNVIQAHRDHAYQHACQQGISHSRVALAVLAINLVWLAPWALACLAFPSLSWVFVGVAYLPLILVARRYQAGVPFQQGAQRR